jgi:cytochrome oxidase assembly protein ShyY1
MQLFIFFLFFHYMFRLHATWQLHKPHKTTQLIKTHMRKPPKAHVFTKTKLALQKQQLPWRRTV